MQTSIEILNTQNLKLAQIPASYTMRAKVNAPALRINHD